MFPPPPPFLYRFFIDVAIVFALHHLSRSSRVYNSPASSPGAAALWNAAPRGYAPVFSRAIPPCDFPALHSRLFIFRFDLPPSGRLYCYSLRARFPYPQIMPWVVVASRPSTNQARCLYVRRFYEKMHRPRIPLPPFGFPRKNPIALISALLSTPCREKEFRALAAPVDSKTLYAIAMRANLHTPGVMRQSSHPCGRLPEISPSGRHSVSHCPPEIFRSPEKAVSSLPALSPSLRIPFVRCPVRPARLLRALLPDTSPPLPGFPTYVTPIYLPPPLPYQIAVLAPLNFPSRPRALDLFPEFPLLGPLLSLAPHLLHAFLLPPTDSYFPFF